MAQSNQQTSQQNPPAADPPKPAPPQSDEVEVTYVPSDISDPIKTKWRGQEFVANVPKKIKDKDLVEAARSNPFFRVAGSAPAKNFNAAPTDHMQYRAYVIDWLKKVSTVDELVSHWSQDRNLRAACEVGSDDLNYLGTIIDPRLNLMAATEGLDAAKVAAIWVRHGVNEIPWRS